MAQNSETANESSSLWLSFRSFSVFMILMLGFEYVFYLILGAAPFAFERYSFARILLQVSLIVYPAYLIGGLLTGFSGRRNKRANSN
jgi:hypothetical protein